MNRIILIVLLMIPATSNLLAADGESLFMESGKIYVVVGSLAIIFLGIIIYLMRLDQRIGKIEKEVDRKEEA